MNSIEPRPIAKQSGRCCITTRYAPALSSLCRLMRKHKQRIILEIASILFFFSKNAIIPLSQQIIFHLVCLKYNSTNDHVDSISKALHARATYGGDAFRSSFNNRSFANLSAVGRSDIYNLVNSILSGQTNRNVWNRNGRINNDSINNNGSINNNSISNGLINNYSICNGSICNGSICNGSICNGSINNGLINNSLINNGSINNSLKNNGSINNNSMYTPTGRSSNFDDDDEDDNYSALIKIVNELNVESSKLVFYLSIAELLPATVIVLLSGFISDYIGKRGFLMYLPCMGMVVQTTGLLFAHYFENGDIENVYTLVVLATTCVLAGLTGSLSNFFCGLCSYISDTDTHERRSLRFSIMEFYIGSAYAVVNILNGYWLLYTNSFDQPLWFALFCGLISATLIFFFLDEPTNIRAALKSTDQRSKLESLAVDVSRNKILVVDRNDMVAGGIEGSGDMEEGRILLADDGSFKEICELNCIIEDGRLDGRNMVKVGTKKYVKKDGNNMVANGRNEDGKMDGYNMVANGRNEDGKMDGYNMAANGRNEYGKMDGYNMVANTEYSIEYLNDERNEFDVAEYSNGGSVRSPRLKLQNQSSLSSYRNRSSDSNLKGQNGEKNDKETPATNSAFKNLKNIFHIQGLFGLKTPSQKKFWIFFVSFATYLFVQQGQERIFVQFLKSKPVSWDSGHIGLFLFVLYMCSALGCYPGYPIIRRFATDWFLSALSLVSKIAGSVLMGFCLKEYLLFFGAVAQMFHLIPFSTFKSIMSKEISEDKQGSIYALLHGVSAVMSFLGPICHNALFTLTVSTNSGVVFLVFGSLIIPFLILILATYKLESKSIVKT